MHANHADIGKRSVAASGPCASTAKISSSPASTRMESATGRRSKDQNKARKTLHSLIHIGSRQLGSLATRVEEYEKLLEDLSRRAGGPDQELIRRALDKVHSVQFFRW